jgi:ankyrin repeat protein
MKRETTKLIDAANRGDVEEIWRLARLGLNLEGRALFGETPLMRAAISGRAMAVSALFKAGALLETRDEGGATALLHAVLHGEADCVAMLIRLGSNVDVLDYSGRSCVGIAAAADDGCLEHLVKGGCKLDSERAGGGPLITAVKSALTDNARMLVQAGANVEARDVHGLTALLAAANEGDEELAGMLLDAGSKIDPGAAAGFTALHYAAVAGNPACLALIVAAGAEIEKKVDPDGRTAAMWAARLGNYKCLGLLLTAGASWDTVDAEGKSLLDWADDSVGDKCKRMALAEKERRELSNGDVVKKGAAASPRSGRRV